MISIFRPCIRGIAGNRFMSSMKQEARILQKLIKKGLTAKKPQVQGNPIITKEFLFTSYENEDCSPRMAVLNKSYMEHINELLHKGKYGRQFADLEIEVTKVKLSKDYNFLNVYFISKNAATESKTLKETLSGALAELQVSMGEFRYLGKVPYLKFVRDSMLENALRLDKVFQDLDFGKDYEPINESKVATEHSSVKDSEPEMRQDVFGVDVAQIKKSVKGSLTRFKAININTSGSDLLPEYDPPQKLMEFNKKDFIKFFKRRRIAELKKRKLENRNKMAAVKYEENDDDYEKEDEVEYELEDYEYFSMNENEEGYMKGEK